MRCLDITKADSRMRFVFVALTESRGNLRYTIRINLFAESLVKIERRNGRSVTSDAILFSDLQNRCWRFRNCSLLKGRERIIILK